MLELTRPDGRVLLLGEHLGRLRDLAEGLLRVGCRVEIVALSRANSDASLVIGNHRLTIVDAIQLTRASVDAVSAARTENGNAQPLIGIVPYENARHRLADAFYVAARVEDNGDLASAPQVVHDILSTWSAVRPLFGPGDLRVDRIARRASIRGRELPLRPFDFRLLRALAEQNRRGCSVEELCTASSTRSRVENGRAMADVRHAVERLRSLFRRTDVALVSSPDGRYRLTARGARQLHRVGPAPSADASPNPRGIPRSVASRSD